MSASNRPARPRLKRRPALPIDEPVHTHTTGTVDQLTCGIHASRRKRTAADDTPRQMLLLLLELLQSGELPELAVGGAWKVAEDLMNRGSAPLGPVALEADICGLATAHLRAIGPAADWMVRTCWPAEAL